MVILVTGAKGFIGKNLVAELKNRNYNSVLEYDIDTDKQLLDSYCKKADFVFHLAGVNRPENQSEYWEGNYGFTSELLSTLKKHENNCPILVTSSIQAEMSNSYGASKKAAEDLLFEYENETGSKVLVYRLLNVFGKWCKPNYNSVIATFCYNIANNLPITINNRGTIMNLVYIDDVVDSLINAMNGNVTINGKLCDLPIVYTSTLGEIADTIYSFKSNREELFIPNMANDLTNKLYSTYLSYLPTNSFKYQLKMNVDCRGSFTEFIKTHDRGQVSVNICKPRVVKGNHWHHSKNEKFLVVAGYGVIRLRKVDTEDIIEYYVSGDKLEVVDIPVGYSHNIENLGDTDLITIMWANECFNPEKPDTYYLEV